VEVFQELGENGRARAQSLGQGQHRPRCRSVHPLHPCYRLCINVVSEYPFARYNAKSPDYSYSQEEYTQFLEGSWFFTIVQLHNLTPLADPEWTREETDYLFNLIREYDSRFYIVNDRYDFPGGPLRSMEVSYKVRLWPFTCSGFAAGFEG